jgi:hypothetical protein
MMKYIDKFIAKFYGQVARTANQAVWEQSIIDYPQTQLHGLDLVVPESSVASMDLTLNFLRERSIPDYSVVVSNLKAIVASSCPVAGHFSNICFITDALPSNEVSIWVEQAAHIVGTAKLSQAIQDGPRPCGLWLSHR